MITQKIVLPHYGNWEIYAYFAMTTYYTDEIMEHLWSIGVDVANARKAYRNLSSGELDTGLCYSNYKRKKTVLVVAKTSSAAEFLNSLTHEVTHACTHIAEEMGVNHKSEDFAYMVGETCREMFPYVKELMCDCCRKKSTHKH